MVYNFCYRIYQSFNIIILLSNRCIFSWYFNKCTISRNIWNKVEVCDLNEVHWNVYRRWVVLCQNLKQMVEFSLFPPFLYIGSVPFLSPLLNPLIWSRKENSWCFIWVGWDLCLTYLLKLIRIEFFKGNPENDIDWVIYGLFRFSFPVLSENVVDSVNIINDFSLLDFFQKANFHFTIETKNIK